MRTTLDLPEAVWRAARERAARDGTTLTAVVTAALQRYLAAPAAERFRLRWVTAPKGVVMPGVDLRSRAAMYDLMDDLDGEPTPRIRSLTGGSAHSESRRKRKVHRAGAR